MTMDHRSHMVGLSEATPGRTGLSGDVERALSTAIDHEGRLQEIINRLGINQSPSNSLNQKDNPVLNLVSSLSALNAVLGRNQQLAAMILKGL